MHCRQYRLGAVSAVSRDAHIHFSRTHCERLKNIFGAIKQIYSKLLYMLSKYILLVVASTNSALKATLQILPRKPQSVKIGAQCLTVHIFTVTHVH